jgi:hypothetical protein
MVVVNTSDGITRSFDLRINSDLAGVLSLIRSNSITALAILHNQVQQVLPLPKRFGRNVTFGVELVKNRDNDPLAERIYLQANDVRINLTRTFKSKLIRTDMIRTGKLRFDPCRR